MKTYTIDDLTKVYVSYGPFDYIKFNSIELKVYRDEQSKLAADFKYDIRFGNHDPESDRQLFIGIDISDIPPELRDEDVSHVYQTSSYISDIKDKSFYVINDTDSRISLPIKSSNLVFWTFQCENKNLDNVRVTCDPISKVNVPIYFHKGSTVGNGMVNQMNNIDMKKPCFNILIDLEKSRNMIEYVVDEDLKVMFDKLDDEEKQVALQFIIKDLPRYAVPKHDKEVNREILLESIKSDEDTNALDIKQEVKDCQIRFEKYEGDARMLVYDNIEQDVSYSYVPTHKKWFMTYG